MFWEKRPQRCDTTHIGSKKIEFHLELRDQLKTLLELDDIDTMRQNITYMIQQNARSVAKTNNKQLESRILSPTRPVMMKQRTTINNEVRRNMHYHKIESKGGHQRPQDIRSWRQRA
jgi:hypothetical protein